MIKNLKIKLINKIFFYFIKLYLRQNKEKKNIMRYILDTNMKNLTDHDKYRHSENIKDLLYPKFKYTEFNNLIFEDKPFIEWYKKFSNKNIISKNNWHSFDRKYNLRSILELTTRVKGDLVEAGCWNGFSASLMCEFANRTDKSKKIHLFDSFEGLSEPDKKKDDTRWWKKGTFAVKEEDLKQNLRKFKNFRIYKGWIPDKFEQITKKKFSFLHIDVDLFKPTLDTLNFFYSRINSGGIILFDDYNFKNCKGHKRAADIFFRNKREKIIPLSSGQSFIIKK